MVSYASFFKLYVLICRYPPHDLPDVVVSELQLWEVKSGLRSIFNNRPDYSVILKQQDLDTQGEMKTSAMFILHESSALDSSRTAYEDIQYILEPLVDDGSVMMTQQLLEGIITPTPSEASRLVFDIVEIMEKNVSIFDLCILL